MLMRSQGRAAWRRFNEALAAGRVPAREVLDGALVIFGGALLLTPGFVTDILGLVLLLPPTRALVRAARSCGALRRAASIASARARRRRRGRRAGRGRRDGDVEGTATEVDPARGCRDASPPSTTRRAAPRATASPTP